MEAVRGIKTLIENKEKVETDCRNVKHNCGLGERWIRHETGFNQH